MTKKENDETDRERPPSFDILPLLVNLSFADRTESRYDTRGLRTLYGSSAASVVGPPPSADQVSIAGMSEISSRIGVPENIVRVLRMFAIFLRIGAFTFGGGFAMLPLIKEELVDKKEWLDEDEFVEIVGAVQSIPGAVAVNMSVFTGHKIGGMAGAVCAGLGVMLPSFLIILAIAMSFGAFKQWDLVRNALRGIRPAVVVLIMSAAISLSRKTITGIRRWVIGCVGLTALVLFGIHPIAVIVGGAAAGLSMYFIDGKLPLETSGESDRG